MRKLLVLFFTLFGLSAYADGLRDELLAFTKNYRAQIGVAVIIDHMDTVCINNSADYPLMSVFKFHQALSVADVLHRRGLSLDAPVYVRKKDLRPDTYSPLRDRFPGGNVWLTVRKLLRYTLQLSDNNACDILFKHFGGPKTVKRYVRRCGLHDFDIRHDEAAMHRRLERCYENRTSPLDAARLIEYVRTREHPGQENFDYIYQLMETCGTGRDRLVAPLLATNAIVGHKTGTGDRNKDGKIIAINDIGYVWQPNHHGYVIAVFVKDSEETPETTAAIIAGISARVWQYVCGLPPIPR